MKVLAELDVGFANLQITTEDYISGCNLPDITASLVGKEDGRSEERRVGKECRL